MKDERFEKILVARDSVKNGCLGPAGGQLVPAIEHDFPGPLRLKPDDHFFVSLDGRHPNSYGWVVQLEVPLSPEQLRSADSESLGSLSPNDSGLGLPPIEWYRMYLRSVSAGALESPMACHWREVRAPGVKRRELVTHKVLFYEGG